MTSTLSALNLPIRLHLGMAGHEVPFGRGTAQPGSRALRMGGCDVFSLRRSKIRVKAFWRKAMG